MSFDFDFDLTAPFLPEFNGKEQWEHRHKIRAVQVRSLLLSDLFAPSSDRRPVAGLSGTVSTQ